MHSDGFKDMENREWASERASIWVSECVCVSVCNCVRGPITSPSCTSNEAQRITALPRFGSNLAKMKANLGYMHACSTWIQKHTNMSFVYSYSSAHNGGLHAELYNIFSPWWQLLCLAGEDVTKILILDKQIATDSLTGQNLQVNRMKNTNIDSNKQIATNWLTWVQLVSKHRMTQIWSGERRFSTCVMCRFRFAD